LGAFFNIFEIDSMFFKLLKELPQMFIIAAIIWFFVLLFINKNSRKKESSFLAKHRSSLIAILVAILLTLGDIWVFVMYIPTHFKKQIQEQPTISSYELLNDSSNNDTTKKPVIDTLKNKSLQTAKSPITDTTQKILITNKASIRFLSRGSAEDIEATNTSVACSINEKNGKIKFTGLIRGFQFENEMMQEHFNDKDYMNSEAFPKTSFIGNIQNIQAINFSKNGNYPATAEGALTIHGITKNIKAAGSIIVSDNNILLKSIFKIKRVDFGINTDEIADELEITVNATFK